MDNSKQDFWEIDRLFDKDCDSCKWANEPLEETIEDGNAPCLRCIRGNGTL